MLDSSKLLEFVPVKINFIRNFVAKLLPVNLLHLVKLNVLSFLSLDQKGYLFLQTDLLNYALTFRHYKLSPLDVVQSFLPERFLGRLFQLPTMEPVYVNASIEVLHDLLKEQILAFFAVLDVHCALNSQVNLRQSFFLALSINLQI